MNPALDAQLCQQYPLIFKNRHGSPRETLMCFGFEVGDGWFDLIDTTCALLCDRYHRAKTDYERLRKYEGLAPYKGGEVVTAVAVEKARLSMSQAAETVPVAIQIKEKYGTLRFYVDGGDTTAQAYIDFAEAYSARLCDVCGAPGKTTGKGWVQTRCEAHASA